MPDSSRRHSSLRTDVPEELVELARSLKQVEAGDAQPVEAAFADVVEMVQRRHRILKLVQDALSQLRLDVKYLMFDLEVTRCERDELQSRLEKIERGY